jgi:hypothetical protein
MPTLLSFTNAFSMNEKTSVSNVQLLEKQLDGGSVQAAIDLAAIIGVKHDETAECDQCNRIANYFIIAFQSTKSQPINATLFTLVTQTIDLVQSHNNTNYSWLTILIKELRDLQKRIKEDTQIEDKYVPLPLPTHFQLQLPEHDTVEEQYGRAIRIAIYHCRASRNTENAMHYFRKCVSILPTPFDYSSLQQSAKQRLMESRPLFKTCSTSSSISSGGNMTCASCGVEKKRMPVCSKCKSQSYCSIRCIKTHKSIHAIDCHQ